jgi:hypothetical protein
MIVSRLKKEENIAEYVLYMLHIEELVKSAGFDKQVIEEVIVSKISNHENRLDEIRNWYFNLAAQLKAKQNRKFCHVDELEEVFAELSFLHNTLLEIVKDQLYIKRYEEAKPYLDELRQKSNHDSINDVQVCFNGLYGMLYLKLRRSEISEETKLALEKIKNLVSVLASEYHKMKTPC